MSKKSGRTLRWGVPSLSHSLGVSISICFNYFTKNVADQNKSTTNHEEQLFQTLRAKVYILSLPACVLLYNCRIFECRLDIVLYGIIVNQAHWCKTLVVLAVAAPISMPCCQIHFEAINGICLLVRASVTLLMDNSHNVFNAYLSFAGVPLLVPVTLQPLRTTSPLLYCLPSGPLCFLCAILKAWHR